MNAIIKGTHCGSSSSLSNSTFVKHNNFFYAGTMVTEYIVKMKYYEIKWFESNYILKGWLNNLMAIWDFPGGKQVPLARSAEQGIAPTKQDMENVETRYKTQRTMASSIGSSTLYVPLMHNDEFLLYKSKWDSYWVCKTFILEVKTMSLHTTNYGN